MNLIYYTPKGKPHIFINELLTCVACDCHRPKDGAPYMVFSQSDIAKAKAKAKANRGAKETRDQVSEESPLICIHHQKST